MGILVVGTVAFDSVKTPHGEAIDALGGSATFFSAAASYYAPVHVIAVVGSDFPMDSLGFLQERGVDLSGVEITEGKTFRWSGEYADNLNDRQTLDTQLNVLSGFRPRLKAHHQGHGQLFLANLDPEIQTKVLRQAQCTGIVVCDTMDFWIKGKGEALQETLRKVDILVVNDPEARQLVNDYNLVRAAERILDLGPWAVVIKRGEHGASLYTRETYFAIPSYPVKELVDPTGAGDTFAGGFVGHLARSGRSEVKNIKQAMIDGTVLASFTVEDFSVRRLRNLSETEISARRNQFLNMIAL